MKIILINPPAYQKKDYIREGRCMQTKSSWAALWMPLSLAYCASLLRKNGHQIKIVDCAAQKIDPKKLLAKIKKFAPALAVVSTAFPSIKGDFATIQKIKTTFPKIKTVAIGLYPTLIEGQCFNECPGLDFSISGEPEWSLARLVDTLEQKKSPSTIPGLIYRQNNTTQKTIPQTFSQNQLVDLPFPARDLLPNNAYRLPINNEPFTLLSIGRGCPHSCIYCVAKNYYGQAFRRRAVDSVIQEIIECQSRYQINNFLFWGESFTLDPAYGEAICNAILAHQIKITWSTASRVDTLSSKLLKKMKQAGCAMLSLGIESTSDEVLAKAGKNISFQQAKEAVKMVKSAGISPMGHFIFGLPQDTQSSAQKTIRFALRSDLDYAQFYCAIPYPKTALGTLAQKNGWIKTRDYSQFELTGAVMENGFLTATEIQKLRDSAYRRFYFRPKMAFLAIKEATSLKNLLTSFDFLKWIKPQK